MSSTNCGSEEASRIAEALDRTCVLVRPRRKGEDVVYVGSVRSTDALLVLAVALASMLTGIVGDGTMEREEAARWLREFETAVCEELDSPGSRFHLVTHTEHEPPPS